MHPAQEEILSFFEYRHLSGDAAAVSMQFHHFANHVVGMEPIRDSDHGAEVTAGLRKLLEAKDCFCSSIAEFGKLNVSQFGCAR